ncbi:MAG: YdeI/OmpD-associated family protein, partial [Bacteroidota bacterium]
GKLFLPVKAAIRKAIRKKEGDYVHVILYADNQPLEIHGELLLCLSDEPTAKRNFLKYTDGEKKAMIEWIYSAKKDETKVERISKAIQMLIKGQKLNDNGKE